MEVANGIQKREATRALRSLTLGFRRRRAISTLIGGLIVLTLILTGVTGMVFVSQQYDQYQQTVNKMAHYQNQAQLENLVANYPGLAIVNSTVSGWSTSASTCGTKTGTTEYNCYVMSLGSSGGVGVQIARIYINSSGPAGSGCSSPNPQPCILNPSTTIAGYTFNQANQFINAGETNHTVVFALPTGVALPAPNPAPYPQNSVVIVTSRGNVYSFQWPFQIQIGGQSASAFSTAIIKVAYQTLTSSSTCTSTTGCDSKNEPGPVAGGSGGTSGAAYCHNEPLAPYPAASQGYAEKLTGINGVGVTGSTLYFVNPWVTDAILDSTIVAQNTQMYIYVFMVNLGTTSSPSYTPTSGSLDLTWYSADHLDGTLIGVYYGNPGQFYPPASAPSIPPGITTTPGGANTYYAIYKINQSTMNLSNDPSGIPSFNSVMFWGDASVTDWGQTNPSAESYGYFSVTFLLSGFWIRSGC